MYAHKHIPRPSSSSRTQPLHPWFTSEAEHANGAWDADDRPQHARCDPAFVFPPVEECPSVACGGVGHECLNICGTHAHPTADVCGCAVLVRAIPRRFLRPRTQAVFASDMRRRAFGLLRARGSGSTILVKCSMDVAEVPRTAKDKLTGKLITKEQTTKPWIYYNEGGYLYSRTHAMRFKDSVEQRSYLKYASEQGHVELVYAGFDVLGSPP
ncbi:hypothetical protein B0H11DRAFT_2291363 [Mycena galericulata]|nr:hypothetical protein B0H11DRAFT_2291363 [Mycena galericulata]